MEHAGATEDGSYQKDDKMTLILTTVVSKLRNNRPILLFIEAGK